MLRTTAKTVDEARTAGADQLDPDLLAALRARYDQAVAWGITTNRHRDWPANTPATPSPSASRTRPNRSGCSPRTSQSPWTNNASEQALRSPKRHQAVSGYWHSTNTLRADLRVRSYLASARGHDIRAIDAIHTALDGNPWLPATA